MEDDHKYNAHSLLGVSLFTLIAQPKRRDSFLPGNMSTTITPDYLVIGAGAMGMAFVDTLITDTKATVAIVDRYARPGGHWTIAYPHVTLHQPSAFYGVNSQEFPGEKNIDKIGGNKGMSELATGDGVCSYFSRVMQQTFLPTGRVEYYPLHEYVVSLFKIHVRLMLT